MRRTSSTAVLRVTRVATLCGHCGVVVAVGGSIVECGNELYLCARCAARS